MAFSVLIGLYGVAVLRVSLMAAAIMGALAFAQTILDSIMGSLLQGKYQCAQCGAITEERFHCGAAARRISGVWWMNNNMVNLISSMMIVAVATAIFAGMR